MSKDNVKQTRESVMKWVFIGFGIAVGVGLLAAILIVFKFTPIVDIDESHERIQLFGGLIDINGDEGLLDFGKDILKHASGHAETGTLAIDSNMIRNLRVPFNNGTMTFRTSIDHKLAWDCRIAGMKKRFNLISEISDSVVMNLDHSAGADCRIAVPPGMNVVVNGHNAKVTIEKPLFNLDLHITNAKVGISPVEGQAYQYSVKTMAGKTSAFESVSGSHAFNISVFVDSGEVTRY